MKNLQGDIIGITDTSGDIVAKYTYDSWGKLISIKDSNDVDKTTDTGFIGYINPLRYRGYYYDTETGLYYLNERYYDPEVGRFISSDETLNGGYNLFEYCHNNPIIFTDEDGKDAILLIDRNSVKLGPDSLGHMGVAIEKNGQWYHFYYGAQNAGLSLFALGGTRAELKRINFNGSKKDHNSINKMKVYEGTYTDSRYIVGDFSRSLDYIKNEIMQHTTYSAIFYNCKHTSIDILSVGTFGKYNSQYKKLLNSIRNIAAPNLAFGRFSTFHDRIN